MQPRPGHRVFICTSFAPSLQSCSLIFLRNPWLFCGITNIWLISVLFFAPKWFQLSLRSTFIKHVWTEIWNHLKHSFHLSEIEELSENYLNSSDARWSSSSGEKALYVCFLYRSVNYNTEILPLTAASPLANLPDDDVAPLMDTL